MALGIYLSFFALILSLVSITLVISSIVLLTKESNDLTKAIMGVSCYYLLCSMVRCLGYTMWSICLSILFVFQTFLWVCLTFYETSTLDKFNEWSREYDGSISEAVRFLDDHLEAFQISMGILSGMIFLALLCIAARQSTTIK
jgi:hypothetical protein